MNMKNAKTQSVFLVFVFVFLADICLANPIVIGAPSNAKYSVATNLGLIINAAVDFVALFIGFSITKQVKTVASWKFLPYFLIVFLGGIIIDVLSIVPVKLFFMLIPAGDFAIFILFVVAGLLLYFFNSWLSDTFFDLEDYQKIIIGVSVALLTNPGIGMLFFAEH